MDTELDRMLEFIDERRSDDAVDLVVGLVGNGHDADDVISRILVPAQLEVGRRWEVGDWTVAQEHAATGVVQAALGAVSILVRNPITRGDVIVACVEHEWHGLPSRFLSERLRLRGWGIEYLGASTPADALYRYAEDGDAIAVIASCQMGMSLPGVARAVDAVHAAGLPVVVGGAAIGGREARARTLGTDAWAPDVDALDRILSAWLLDPPERTAQRQGDGGEHLEVLGLGPRFATLITEAVRDEWPTQPVDLHNLLGFLAGAVVADDADVFVDYARWLQSLVVSRGGRAGLVDVALEAAERILPEGCDRAHATVTAARASLASPASGA